MNEDPENTLDEMLSADLDGETTPAEHQHIEADDGLKSRREELRRAASFAGRQPPALDPAEVDRIVRGAADVFARDESDTGDEPAVAAPPPPRRLPGSKQRQTSWLVAAAVILLAAIGVGLVVTADPPADHGTSASKAGSADQESQQRSSGGAAATTTSPAQGDSPTAASGAIGFLGTFSSSSELRSALQKALPSPRRAPTPEAFRVSSGQADRCAAVVESRDRALTRANRRSALAASVAGEPVLVFEYRARAVGSTRTTTRVVVMGVVACDERLNFER